MSAPNPQPAQPAGARPANGGPPLDALLDVSLPVVIEIGRSRMTVQEVLDLSVGAVVQLDRMVGEPVDVYVSDRKLAQGEVVVVGDHFGVRITRIVGETAGLGAKVEVAP